MPHWFSSSLSSALRSKLLRYHGWRHSSSTHLGRVPSHAVGSIPQSFWGLRGFILGIGSSAAAFAVASYKKSDSRILNVLVGRDGTLDSLKIQNPQYTASELQSLLPTLSIITDQVVLQTYGFRDLAAAVLVRSTEDVVGVVNFARDRKIPLIVAYGLESCRMEGLRPDPIQSGSIVVDLSGMSRVLHVHEEDRDVVCQAGASLQVINQRLAEQQTSLVLPIEPLNEEAIGSIIGSGFVSNNSNWIINATVVLPSGQVIKTQRRARKPGSGLDTTRLFIGTQGTLGIITEVTLRVVPRVPDKIAIAQFTNPSAALTTALDLLNSSQRAQIRSIDFADKEAIATFNESAHAQLPIQNTLIFKFSGSDDDAAARRLSVSLSSYLKKHAYGLKTFMVPTKDDTTLWTRAIRPPTPAQGTRARETVVSVPISRLPQLLQEAKHFITSQGLSAEFISHVQDGTFRTFIRYESDDQLPLVNDAIAGLVHRVLALDGSCTGDNGVGPDTKDYIVEELGPHTVELMRTVKKAMDPNNILNPHKEIFPD